jgi:hypothetical protein
MLIDVTIDDPKARPRNARLSWTCDGLGVEHRKKTTGIPAQVGKYGGPLSRPSDTKLLRDMRTLAPADSRRGSASTTSPSARTAPSQKYRELIAIAVVHDAVPTV